MPTNPNDGTTMTDLDPVNDPQAGDGGVNPTPEDQAKVEADNRRKQFEAKQETDRKVFERDFKASKRRAQREHDVNEARLKKEREVHARRMERQNLAMNHGYLTDGDLIQRQDRLAPHHDYLEPWQVTADGDDTVLMAFPRDTYLTLSASDFRRISGIEEKPNDETIGQGAITQGARVLFRKGYEDVPVWLADHPYLYANGAFRVNDSGDPESEEDREKRLHNADKPQPAPAFEARPASLDQPVNLPPQKNQ